MIQVKNLYKSFGQKKVLCGVDLEVKDGETLVIIGGSGAGKSILLKNIVGLMKPDKGNILIDDVDITKVDKSHIYEIQRKIGFLFQEAALFDSLTIEENIAFGIKNLTNLTKEETKTRVSQCLNMVGLSDIEHLKPSALSGGMKKRVGLARAIAYKPKYVCYDEPTTGLDPIMSDVIGSLITYLKKELAITSIVVTHDMQSAYKIADRIVMLYEGKVIFDGTANEVKQTKNTYVKQFVEGLREGPIPVETTFTM
ncbi:MAG: ABC transporter ATP-binding protein [Endomicrobiia bacterium]|jgi:phospholipid/cholesterol/gamma-HCH transport system ATP-binding protein|nr:ABC transporter ATP-binding protein [Endomicrobiaceae bacterium]MDD3922165.1 ABC transporter ATP-binding protein [Endomicrobiaceae bacterium]